MKRRNLSPSSQIDRWFFVGIGIVILALIWTIVQPFVFVLLASGIAAIILSPLDRVLNGWLKHQRIASGFIVLGVFLLVVIPIFVSLIVMTRQATDLFQFSVDGGVLASRLDIETLPFTRYIPPVLREQIQSFDIDAATHALASWTFDNIGTIFASTSRVIIDIFVFFVALYYLLVDRRRLTIELVRLSPFDDKIDQHIMRHLIHTVRSIVFGVLLLAIIQGILAAIGMTIFHVPGSFLFGALTIFAALIPLVGSALVLVPATLYLFLSGKLTAAIGLLIWSMIVVGTSDNILAPYLIRGTTRMHTFLVLLAILGGMRAFGPLGAIAGPMILAAFLVVLELYKTGILKETPEKPAVLD